MKNTSLCCLVAIMSCMSLSADDWQKGIDIIGGNQGSVNESSGICRSLNFPNTFWTHGDSSCHDKIYRFDRSGRVIQTVAIPYDNRDWEDISSARIGGKNYIVIGNIGNNPARGQSEPTVHKDLALIIIEEPSSASASSQSITKIVRFTWSDGNPHDCEAMALAKDGNVYLVSKGQKNSQLLNYVSVFNANGGFKSGLDSSIVATLATTSRPPINYIASLDVSADGLRMAFTDVLNDTAYELRRSSLSENWNFNNNVLINLGGNAAQREALCYDFDDYSLCTTSERSEGWHPDAQYAAAQLYFHRRSGGPTVSNVAPTVSAGDDASITFPTNTYYFNSSKIKASDDGLPARSTFRFNWIIPAGVTFSSPSTATTLHPTVRFAAAGVYEFTLSGTDGTLTTTDKVKITVNNSGPVVNTAPRPNAGLDQNNVILPATTRTVDVALRGSASDDGLPARSTISYLWTLKSGPAGAAVRFANATAASTTATFTKVGTYTLTLKASDSALFGTDDIQVKVALSAGTMTPIVYQAEDSSTVVVGGLKHTSFVDFTLKGAHSIEWKTVTAPRAGNYMLTFSYAFSSGNRPLSIVVNNVGPAVTLSFPNTGSSSTYKSISMPVTLKAGANSIKASDIGYGVANLDSLTLSAVPVGHASLPMDHILGSLELTK